MEPAGCSLTETRGFFVVFRSFLFFPKLHHIRRAASPGLILSGIVLPCGIDVLMTQDIRHQIDIAGFLIQRCTVGTP